jgi:hypothetical protein
MQFISLAQRMACLSLTAQQMAMLKACLIDLDGNAEGCLTDLDGSHEGSPD